MPAHTAARAGVEDAGKIEPAHGGFDVGDVGDPDLVGAIRDRHFAQPGFGDWQLVGAVGSRRPKASLLLWAQTALAHQAGDAILAAAFASPAQGQGDARAAIVWRLSMNIGVIIAASSLSCRHRAPASWLWCAWKPLLETFRASASSVRQCSFYIVSITAYRLLASRPTRCPKLFLRCRAGGADSRFPAASDAAHAALRSPPLECAAHGAADLFPSARPTVAPIKSIRRDPGPLEPVFCRCASTLRRSPSTRGRNADRFAFDPSLAFAVHTSFTASSAKSKKGHS